MTYLCQLCSHFSIKNYCNKYQIPTEECSLVVVRGVRETELAHSGVFCLSGSTPSTPINLIYKIVEFESDSLAE
jgi:hypothetical protein